MFKRLFRANDFKTVAAALTVGSGALVYHKYNPQYKIVQPLTANFLHLKS